MNRIVALGIVFAIFTAMALVPALPASAQATDERELQTLVNDTAFQFKLSHRHNATELANHYEQLNTVVAAWNASARGDADDRRLAEWLRESIQASMPGSVGELPAAPKFDPKPKPAAPAARPRAEELPTPAAARDDRVRRTSAETMPEPASRSNDSILNRAPETTTEQTLLRPTSAPSTPAEELDLFSNESGTGPTVPETPSTGGDTQTTEESGSDSVENFWSEHPASGELPAELSSGDPFLDDPAPAEE